MYQIIKESIMRGVVLPKIGVEKESRINFVFLQKYLFIPVQKGLFGYVGFFVLLLISKYLGYLIGNRSSFQVDNTDFLLSLLGFAFIFVVELRETTKGKAL
jgi:hypothetical protein